MLYLSYSGGNGRGGEENLGLKGRKRFEEDRAYREISLGEEEEG